VSLQGQGTTTFNSSTFGDLPSDRVQINGAEKKDYELAGDSASPR